MNFNLQGVGDKVQLYATSMGSHGSFLDWDNQVWAGKIWKNLDPLAPYIEDLPAFGFGQMYINSPYTKHRFSFRIMRLIQQSFTNFSWSWVSRCKVTTSLKGRCWLSKILGKFWWFINLDPGPFWKVSIYSSCDLRLLSAPIWRIVAGSPLDQKQLPHLALHPHATSAKWEKSWQPLNFHVKKSHMFHVKRPMSFSKSQDENPKNHFGRGTLNIHAPTYIPTVCISTLVWVVLCEGSCACWIGILATDPRSTVKPDVWEECITTVVSIFHVGCFFWGEKRAKTP